MAIGFMSRSVLSWRRRRFATVVGAIVLVTGSLFTASVTARAASSLPCDIYGNAGAPCVAAYSSVRALYSSYSGPLYQVTRSSDNATLDVGVLSAGGYANAAAQDSFCSGTACVITKIYDQSAKHNDLTIAGAWRRGARQRRRDRQRAARHRRRPARLRNLPAARRRLPAP